MPQDQGPHPLAEDHGQHIDSLGTQGDPEADLAGASRDPVGDHTIQPDHGEPDRHRGEQPDQHHVEARPGQ